MGAHSRGVHLFDNPLSTVGEHSRGALDRGITIVQIATGSKYLISGLPLWSCITLALILSIGRSRINSKSLCNKKNVFKRFSKDDLKEHAIWKFHFFTHYSFLPLTSIN